MTEPERRDVPSRPTCTRRVFVNGTAASCHKSNGHEGDHEAWVPVEFA